MSTPVLPSVFFFNRSRYLPYYNSGGHTKESPPEYVERPVGANNNPGNSHNKGKYKESYPQRPVIVINNRGNSKNKGRMAGWVGKTLLTGKKKVCFLYQVARPKTGKEVARNLHQGVARKKSRKKQFSEKGDMLFPVSCKKIKEGQKKNDREYLRQEVKQKIELKSNAGTPVKR